MIEIKQQKPNFDDEWLKIFYDEVGRETSLARESQRETHNWVITLTAGILTAFVAISGKAISYPSETLFIGILIVTPLLFRFFVRSCLEYQIFNRWSTIRNGLDFYFFYKTKDNEKAEQALAYLDEIIPIYYFQWKASKPFLKMFLDNIKLAYGWPFLILTALIVWAIIKQPMTKNICLTLWIFIPWMSYELYTFFTYRGFNYYEPTIKLSSK